MTLLALWFAIVLISGLVGLLFGGGLGAAMGLFFSGFLVGIAFLVYWCVKTIGMAIGLSAPVCLAITVLLLLLIFLR